MTTIELIEKYIIKNSLLSDINDSVEYIRDYGDIDIVYKEDESIVISKVKELEEVLQKANNVLNDICELVKDNYEC